MAQFRTVVLSYLVLSWGFASGFGGVKKGTDLEGWGTIVDPAGDCKATLNDGKLTIVVPGTQHNLNPLPGWNNLLAPRVVQDAKGDFSVQVKALAFPMPQPKSSSNKEKPDSYVGGGILIWKNGTNFTRLFRAAHGDSKIVGIHMEDFKDGKMTASLVKKIVDKDIYLKVERKDGKLSYFSSEQGEKWVELPPRGRSLPLADDVKIGVAVINATTKEISHQFEMLKVTRK